MIRMVPSPVGLIVMAALFTLGMSCSSTDSEELEDPLMSMEDDGYSDGEADAELVDDEAESTDEEATDEEESEESEDSEDEGDESAELDGDLEEELYTDSEEVADIEENFDATLAEGPEGAASDEALLKEIQQDAAQAEETTQFEDVNTETASVAYQPDLVQDTNVEVIENSQTLPFDPSGVVVHFAFDSDRLSQASKDSLFNLSEQLRGNPENVIKIAGHTDERGSASYNKDLGERRSQAVRDYLVSLGVRADRLRVISYGEDMPVAIGTTEEAYRQNRRATFAGE